MGFTFIHAADLHLGGDLSAIGLRSPEAAATVRRAPEAALERLVDLTLAERAELLLLSGDVFDGPWRDMRAGLAFAAACARLTRAGVRVAMIKGNHDAESVVADALSWPDGVRVFGANAAAIYELPELGAAITGRSFRDRDTSENLAAGYPRPRGGRFEIAMLHTSCDGRPGHASYAPCSPQELAAAGFDYWALGHVHAQETLSSEPWIVYPGCLQGRTWREHGPKGAMVVRVDGERVVSARFAPCDAARWALIEPDLTGVGDAATARRLLRDALGSARDAADGRPLIARVVYGGATGLDAELRRAGARLQAEAQATAFELGEDVAIEAVRLRTLPDAGAPAAPSAALIEAVTGAAGAAALELDADLDAILSKLGPEAASIDVDVDALLDDARGLALAEAATGTGGSQRDAS